LHLGGDFCSDKGSLPQRQRLCEEQLINIKRKAADQDVYLSALPLGQCGEGSRLRM